jgi:hypothetical protein
MRGQARCDLDGHGRRRLVSRVTLVSFDIDGTLEVGEPPGIVPVALVREAKRLGYVVGSCSDRPVSFQQNLWERLRIAVDFTVLKHRLPDVRAQFTAAAYYHIGDTEVDAFYANAAGFSFLRADAETRRLWPPDLFVPPLDGRCA